MWTSILNGYCVVEKQMLNMGIKKTKSYEKI